MSKNPPGCPEPWRSGPGPTLAAAIVLSLAALALAGGGGGGQERPATPRAPGAAEEGNDKTRKDYGGDCLESGCHSRLAKTQFVHAPVAIGACAGCHEPDGEAAGHRFKLSRAEKDLCSFCHRPKTAAKFVHTAYQNGQCTGCHDPHGGRDSLYLKSEDRSALCKGCHDARFTPQHGAAGGKTPFAFLHEPVAEGKCADCHVAHQSDQPALLPVAERDLCLNCHEAVLTGLRDAAHVHKPLESECGSCHSGHGGADPRFLRGAPRDLCLRCHALVLDHAAGGKTPFAFLHEPVAEGKCADCHVAHQSDQPALLPVAERDLCLNCHEAVLTGLRDAAHVHKPLESECGSCHAGHGGADPRFLRGAPRDLCLRCHAAVLDPATASGSLHAPVSNNASCLDCHVGHAGASRALVSHDLRAACYRCHAEEISLVDGRKLTNVEAQVASAAFVHDPVAKGACDACHLGHSSPHGDLLAKAYPLGLYAESAPPTFELCFGCHDARLATAERTDATQFRDGDRNLHHVHTRGKKGRTCALCHEPHASAHPGLTRDAVSLGPRAWRVAIGFRRTETGGACASGCHQQMSYRNRP